MQLLGIRTAPKTIRYAIIDWDGKDAIFVNADGENKIDFPADANTIEKKLYWLFRELERILIQYPGIDQITIKTNEYRPKMESVSSREAAYLDAVIVLFAEKENKKVELKLYRGIGTKRDEVKEFAERNIGISTRYWDIQMADAVVAAWSTRAN